MHVRFLGHSCFELTDGRTTLLVDPFLSGNPLAAATADEVAPDAILLTHGHPDHVGDTVAIARRTGAALVSTFYLAPELAEDLPEGHPVAKANLGGRLDFDWGGVRFVPALHASRTPKGAPELAAGLVIEFAGRRIYHLGDTALTSDLALAGRGEPFDLAMVCIGGGPYTMDRIDGVTAAGLVGARTIVPCHYDTLPAIRADAGAYKADVEAAGHAEVAVLRPGGELAL
jgi:L-ascorbate metabolism protein UlaG (beta-lactamase superfamily)